MIIKINKIYLLLLSVFSYFITVGLSAVLLPIVLNYNDISEFLIGISDNVKIISGLFILMILPKIANKLGIVEIGIISLLFYAISLLLLPFYYNYLWWLFLIFLFGAGFIVFRTMEETLANVIANNKNRGKIIGYVSTSMLCGLSVGPIIPKIFGANNYLNFLIGFLCVCISAICFLKLKTSQGYVKPTTNFKFFKFLKEQPLVFFSKFILEFLIQIIFVFIVIYVINTTNYSAENAGLIITAFSLSGFFNVFVGNFLDKIKNKNSAMIFGTFIIFICFILLPFTLKVNILLTYILFFIFGLCGSSLVFLSSMFILNSSYKKSELVGANSALTISDAIAMISSSFFTGISMKFFNSNGLFIPIYLLLFLYVVFCFYYFLIKEKNHGKSRK